MVGQGVESLHLATVRPRHREHGPPHGSGPPLSEAGRFVVGGQRTERMNWLMIAPMIATTAPPMKSAA